MKRMLFWILILALGASLVGCKNSDDGTALMSQLGGFAQSTKGQDFGIAIPSPTWQNAEVEDVTRPAAEAVVTQPGVQTVVLPFFENQSLDRVIQWLSASGISYMIEYEYNNQVQENYVISQSIPGGQEITTDTVLTLFASRGAEACPYDYAQKLTVQAAAGSSYATATLYEWQNGGWQSVVTYNACVGKNGIGPAAEGSQRSPEGIHRLGIVLTANAVSTNMAVQTVTANTCVVDDKASSYYNMIMDKGLVPYGVSYDQIGTSLTNGTTFATIYIEHNGSGLSSENVIPGKGSAIGVRGQYGTLNPTYGDVDISYRDMTDLLSRLDAAKSPVIELIVG